MSLIRGGATKHEILSGNGPGPITGLMADGASGPTTPVDTRINIVLDSFEELTERVPVP